MPESDTFRSLWDCLKASLRVILFLLCFMIVLGESIILLVLIFGNSSTLFSVVTNTWVYYVSTIIKLSVALVGCYGTFYKDLKYLKLVSISKSSTSSDQIHQSNSALCSFSLQFSWLCWELLHLSW